MSDNPAFYHPSQMRQGDAVAVAGEQFRHLRALRLREGDAVLLLNGRGLRADAVIESVDRASAQLRVIGALLDNRENVPYIAAAIGILDDRTRLEWSLEKAVELGADEFIPVGTERSEGRLQQSRLERIAVAALKQSQRSFLPQIRQPVPFADLLAEFPSFDRRYICHERASAEQTLAGVARRDADARRILLLVGPEGGFSGPEIEAAVAAGAVAVSLGRTRLRAETAFVAALAVLRLKAESQEGNTSQK